MNVAELIEKLKDCPPEAEVLTRDFTPYGECLEPVNEVEVIDDSAVLVWA